MYFTNKILFHVNVEIVDGTVMTFLTVFCHLTEF